MMYHIADGPPEHFVPYGDRYYLLPHARTLYVAPAIIQAHRQWSEPVQFKFEEQDDGSVVMWIRTVKHD